MQALASLPAKCLVATHANTACDLFAIHPAAAPGGATSNAPRIDIV